MLDFFRSNKNISNTPSVLSPMGEPLNTNYSGDYTENKKSPFSIYPGDSHKLILPQKKTSIDEVDYLLSIGYIGDIENAILTVIHKMYYVTSLQIYQMLILAGIDIKHQNVQYSIRKLKNKNFIKQIEFFSESDETARSSFKAYTLGYHGLGILRARGNKAKLQGYISEIPTANLKRVLAANQLLISVMQTSPFTFESIPIVFDDSNSQDIIIRPQAILQNENDSYFVECIRKDTDWEENLCERMIRYQRVIENYETLNIKFNKAPLMIFLAENFEHMLEIQNLTAQYTGIIKLFTYDLALYENVHAAFYKNS